MPRLKLGEDEKRRDRLNGFIAYHMKTSHLSKGEMVDKAGIARSTFFHRENDPKRFTLGELLSVANVLNVSVVTLVQTYAEN